MMSRTIIIYVTTNHHNMKLINKDKVTSLIVSLVLFAAVPVAFAWTSAPSNPPSNNTPAPVNIGSEPQIKNGFFGLYGGTAGMAISKGDLSYTLKNGLSLGVKGKIGADFYCNADGTKCADIDQLMGNTVVNNTTNGCKYEQKTSQVSIRAGGSNNKGTTQVLAQLIPGTWTVSGSGTSGKGCGDKCGSPTVYIRVTKNMSASAAGYKSLVSKLGKWEVPETTFVITQNEQLVALGYEALITGTMTVTGPQLVCPTN
jgi:hypothetical protein